MAKSSLIGLLMTLASLAAYGTDLYPYHTGLAPADYNSVQVECSGSICWHLRAPKIPVVVFGDYTNGQGLAPGAWHTITLDPFIPEQAKLIQLTGMVTITRGNNDNQTCLIKLYAREYGSTDYTLFAKAQMDYTEAGTRPQVSAAVPLDSNRFQFRWESNTPRYPTGCGTSVWLALQWYVR